VAYQQKWPFSGHFAAQLGILTVGFVMIWFVVYRCLRDGVVVSRRWRVERASRPVLYWLLIVLFVLLSCVIVWAAIHTAMLMAGINAP
jgi:hypothetical protein